MSAAAGIAEQVCALRLEHIPEPALELIRRAHIDTIGVALLGTRLESAQVAARVGLDLHVSGPSSVWGMGAKTDVLTAALINGTAAHAELFDDNSAPMIAHPSAPLVAALLPLAQARRSSGAEVAVAYCAGFEVGVGLGRVLNPAHYEAGWHATSVLGVLGATAACAKLLRMDSGRTAQAIAIAVSMASGVRQAFGSMAMALHSGLCARNAVHAALLAEAGFAADSEALEGRYGFFRLYAGGPPERLPTLFEPFELLVSGIIVKPFPTGAPTLAAIDAALRLRSRIGDPDRIARIECYVHPWNEMTLRKEPPSDTLKAKVNLPYCVSAALVFGRLTYRELEGDCLRDPRVAALIGRTTIATSANLPDNAEFPAELVVTLDDGNRLVERCEVPPGGSSRPLPRELLLEKFASCAELVLDPNAQRATVADLDRLELLPDLATLCERLEGHMERPRER